MRLLGLFLILPALDNWLFVNNSGDDYEVIAEGAGESINISNLEKWEMLKSKYYGK